MPCLYDAQFALDLIQNLSLQDNSTSLIVSPICITLALTLAYIGSAGNTRCEFQHRFKINDISEHQFLSRVSKFVESSNAEDALYNAWSQGYIDLKRNIREEYQKKLATLFGTSFKRLDFTNQQLAAKTINFDVSQHTNGKIKKVIFLLSTIYMRAPWYKNFGINDTKNKTFHLNSNTQRSIEMMHMGPTKIQDSCKYAENNLFRMLQLPYAKSSNSSVDSDDLFAFKKFSNLRFNILLPKKRFGLDSALQKMDAASFLGLLNTAYEASLIASSHRIHF
ncbi:Serine proteinase inhibitor [Aphelenchoides besseyi]|nr:Serine proteinase inhibitor [Aphelenchoides besseyi]